MNKVKERGMIDLVLEKTLESPLDWKDIKPVNFKEHPPWIFIGRTDAEAAILLPPGVKSWLIRKDPDAEKDWRQETMTTEDEIVGGHHRLDGHEFEHLRVWWRTGKPGMPQSMGSQRVRHNWLSEWLSTKQNNGDSCLVLNLLIPFKFSWENYQNHPCHSLGFEHLYI